MIQRIQSHNLVDVESMAGKCEFALLDFHRQKE